jgi:hypothetical protein
MTTTTPNATSLWEKYQTMAPEQRRGVYRDQRTDFRQHGQRSSGFHRFVPIHSGCTRARRSRWAARSKVADDHRRLLPRADASGALHRWPLASNQPAPRAATTRGRGAPAIGVPLSSPIAVDGRGQPCWPRAEAIRISDPPRAWMMPTFAYAIRSMTQEM